jgi:hypothetical protein
LITLWWPVAAAPELVLEEAVVPAVLEQVHHFQ